MVFFPVLYSCDSLKYLMFYRTVPIINGPEEKHLFENNVGKEEKAGYQHFLIFPSMFSLLTIREIITKAGIHLASANVFNLV